MNDPTMHAAMSEPPPGFLQSAQTSLNASSVGTGDPFGPEAVGEMRTGYEVEVGNHTTEARDMPGAADVFRRIAHARWRGGRTRRPGVSWGTSTARPAPRCLDGARAASL